ncbi:MAG: hypothetical protein COT84_01400 [Chlamydiae bacterium CG10_big_fil_rev_8_21_14_0_10_35_9]|nr:MAG: hypothetical protein COT84_01400 [Chlamydiae bacterium CG10_big_fil_rev_8_21_14_0_10_35_9]
MTKRSAVELEIDYIDANMPIYFRFGLLQQFSKQEIQSAALKLVIKHPFLRSIISDKCFVEMPTINESCIQHVGPIKNNETMFSYDLNPKNNLLKILFWHEHDKTHFLMILHHAIADVASSLNVIDDFVKYLYFPNTSVNKLSMPKSIEDYFTWKPTLHESAEYAQKLNQYLSGNPRTAPMLDCSDTGYEEQTARMKFFQVSSLHFQRLQSVAKEKQLSINALLTAYFIQALSLKGTVCIGAAVDLRKRLKNKIPCDVLITAPVGAFIFLNIDQSSDVYTIAKDYQQQLLDHMNSPNLLLQHYAILRGQLDPLEFNVSFFLSNAGKTAYSKETEDKVAYTSFAAEAVLNCPYIACISHQKMINLSITYPDPWMTSSLIDQLISPLCK